ncbi:MAG: hypothetical protein DRP45_06320 [Candidatus Zixiibacteriota bacterium]|nr:MAG: hypothetical protein DRP45_06320 [candidate division Zixibacteria bacterium]
MKKTIHTVCVLIACCGLAGTLCAEVREPAVAGMFYPADSAELAQLVTDHLQKVEIAPDADGELIALVVPHAGLRYSGQIAARAYKLLEGSGVENVVLVGPSHRYRFEGASVYGPGVTWKTPLGAVPCNDNLCNSLLEFDRRISVVLEAHAREHSLEIQLPYLISVLDKFQIVPIVLSDRDAVTIDRLAEALIDLKDDGKTVMVASTDWQHFRPASQGWPKDSLGIECVKALDVNRLEGYLRTGEVEMCGADAIVAVLKAAIAKGANSVRLLAYGDSGDITGDKQDVVGYAALAIYRSESASNARKDENEVRKETAGPDDYLSDSDKAELLSLARRSIEAYLSSAPPPELEYSGVLAEMGAAFVTLEKDGRLRGCIGYTVPVEPLAKTVSTCAVQAAVSDPRFPPVTATELNELHIEISVLTPLKRVESLEDIEVGRDGLMISMGNRRGLLLPQVATDYGWNRTEFLEHTCQKAGLPTDAYKSSETTIESFQAIIFAEEE